jgi:prepilin-type N-terminal cleavage/methylation domain-containing protein
VTRQVSDGRRGRRDQGFTLVELMVVVAMIAVLAAIVVPIFMRETRESTAEAEVNAMFTELGLKEAAYKLENGAYLSTGADESDTWPTAPGTQLKSVFPLPATWTLLKVVPPESEVKCGYVVLAGDGGAAPGAIAAASFGLVAPQDAYYYVLAHCDLDGDPASDAYYFQSSVDAKIRSINPGD